MAKVDKGITKPPKVTFLEVLYDYANFTDLQRIVNKCMETAT